MTTSNLDFSGDIGRKRDLRFGLVVALLALFGLSLIAGWHDVAFAGHDHGYSSVTAADGVAHAGHDDDDENQPDHLAAHAALQNIDLPPVALTVLSQPRSAEVWHPASAVFGPLAVPVTDIRPPRG